MFVMALTALARFKPAPGEPFELKQLAELASNERYPTDAWVFGNFAGEFLFHGMFDDAIIYSEKAIKIRTYGGARLALAASLYAKAAKLTQENNINEAQKFILRARLLRFGRDDILARLERTGGEAILPLLPTIEGTLWGARCDE